jgi:hypothetical protein
MDCVAFIAPIEIDLLHVACKFLIHCFLKTTIGGYTIKRGFIMRKAFALIFALHFLASIASPQDKAIYPLELSKGKAWNSKTAVEKREYLIGFYEGLAIISTEGDSQCLSIQEKSKSSYQGLLTYESIMTGVDAFFRKETYQSLPVIVALEYVAKEAKGATPKELNEFVTYKRKVFSKVSPNQ